MCKLRKIIKNNSGSATVEVSLVIPVVILIVFMTITLFIHNVQDGILQGTICGELYMHSNMDGEQELRDNIYIKLEETLLGEKNISVNVNDEKGASIVKVSGTCGSGMLEYILSDISYGTETDLCTSRLRRWQLYGDVLPD